MQKLLVIIMVMSIVSCSSSRIYIVRHAERGSLNNNPDPELTDTGRQRAIELAHLMKGRNITAVYSTKFKRTTQTAMPLAEQNGIPILFYNVDTSGRFIKKILGQKKNVLIVSHSNRILPMLDSIPLHHTLTTIPDDDFDNMFIITVKRKIFTPVKYFLKETTYGAPSPAMGVSVMEVMR